VTLRWRVHMSQIVTSGFSEHRSRNRQRGVALLMALIALLIIGAITAGAILLSNTETSISSNFRDEQLAFFSAKAGIEEACDRMQAGVTDTIRTASLPTTLPGTTGSVLYILNPANGETVAPWNGSSSTTYPDDEICKETTSITCSSNLPNLSSCSSWCVSTTASSVYAASPILPWKWVRVMLKQNNALPLIPPMAAAAPARRLAGTEPMKRPLVVLRPTFYLSIP
jgi:Tfp pilus assembly protein PilX